MPSVWPWNNANRKMLSIIQTRVTITRRSPVELIRDDVTRSFARKLLSNPEPVEDRLREIRGLEISADLQLGPEYTSPSATTQFYPEISERQTPV